MRRAQLRRLAGRMEWIAEQNEPCEVNLRARSHLRGDATPHRLTPDEERPVRHAGTRTNRIDHRAPRSFEDVVLVGRPPPLLGVKEVEGHDTNLPRCDNARDPDHPRMRLWGA